MTSTLEAYVLQDQARHRATESDIRIVAAHSSVMTGVMNVFGLKTSSQISRQQHIRDW